MRNWDEGGLIESCGGTDYITANVAEFLRCRGFWHVKRGNTVRDFLSPLGNVLTRSAVQSARMPRYLDLATWPRRAVFEFYLPFDKPYFNVCTLLDVTNLLKALKTR